MPAKDLFYKTVQTALVQDGWLNIKPLKLNFNETSLEVDLSADKFLTAQKGTLSIAVEVKSFVAASIVYAFHQAIGQYIHYRMIIRYQNLGRILYLAVPLSVYEQELNKSFFQASVTENQVNLLIVNDTTQKVEQWIPNPEQ
jgi:XisH protein